MLHYTNNISHLVLCVSEVCNISIFLFRIQVIWVISRKTSLLDFHFSMGSIFFESIVFLVFKYKFHVFFRPKMKKKKNGHFYRKKALRTKEEIKYNFGSLKDFLSKKTGKSEVKERENSDAVKQIDQDHIKKEHSLDKNASSIKIDKDRNMDVVLNEQCIKQYYEPLMIEYNGRQQQINIGEESQDNVFVKRDVGLVSFPIDHEYRNQILSKGADFFRNMNAEFPIVDKRRLATKWFFVEESNKSTLRNWMIYSPHKNSIFCFYCFLLKTESKKQTAFSSQGFNSWKHCYPALSRHETSTTHKNAESQYFNLMDRLKCNHLINVKDHQENLKVKNYWKAIMRRLFDVVCFLAKQNLAFRGHRGENLNCLLKNQLAQSNQGNYMGLVSLISKYDSILRKHIEYSIHNCNHKSYTSNDSQNKILEFIALNLKQKIKDEISRAKYYTMIIDSTPDISKVDQYALIIRYISEAKDQNLEIKESFITFFEIEGKSSSMITEGILKVLKSESIPLKNCRGQVYDNASVLSGIHTGVQKKILEINPFATFINCSNHSLCLTISTAAESDATYSNFFGTVNKIFNFFSKSTSRWEELTKNSKETLKAFSKTRWSARFESIHAMKDMLGKVIELLRQYSRDASKKEACLDSEMLLSSILKYEFIFNIYLWDIILSKVNHATLWIQKKDITAKFASSLLDNLSSSLNSEKEDLYTNAIKNTITTCEELGIDFSNKSGNLAEKKLEKKRIMIELEIKTSDLINIIIEQIQQRNTYLMDTVDRYQFLFDLHKFDSFVLESKEKMKVDVKKYCTYYSSNVDEIELYNEIISFSTYCRKHNHILTDDIKNTFQKIRDLGQEGLFYLQEAFQILLTIGISNATAERSFSKLKLIKNYLRNSMSNERLSHCGIISIENNFLTDDFIDECVELYVNNKRFLKRK